jgi:integrase
LDLIARRGDGKPSAATTVARKRAVLSGTFKYAVELRQLDSHPFGALSWTPPKAAEEIDRRVVANPQQAHKLLEAVGTVAPEMTAFFAAMYYSALRPEEALHLRAREIIWPAEEGQWGWLLLTGATVNVGRGWGDEDRAMEDRGLKHRPKAATRRAPAPPQLLAALRRHLDDYGTAEDERLFVTRRGPSGRFRPSQGQPLSSNAYTRVWRRARAAALTAEQQDSPLARVPYHLRHAAVSLWLSQGVPAPQVAEWAGHSVNVLLRVYAKCVDGQEGDGMARIGAALGPM